MENDSGQLEFSTVIAYLLPGFIVEIIGLSLIDSLNIFFRSPEPSVPLNDSLLLGLRFVGAGEGALLLAISLGIAYFMGLVLDFCAHPQTLALELQFKTRAYRQCYDRLVNLIDNKQLSDFLKSEATVTRSDTAASVAQAACAASEAATRAAAAAMRAAEAANLTDVRSAQPEKVVAANANVTKAGAALQAARTSQHAAEVVAEAVKGMATGGNLESFVDAVFFRTATSEAWARHNWSWSFYEAARQLTSLTKPVWIAPVAFYASLIFVRFFFPALDRGRTFGWATIASLGLIVLTWVFLHRKIKQYRDEICEFYHTYKANFVFGHLIQTGIIENYRISLELSDKH